MDTRAVLFQPFSKGQMLRKGPDTVKIIHTMMFFQKYKKTEML